MIDRYRDEFLDDTWNDVATKRTWIDIEMEILKHLLIANHRELPDRISLKEKNKIIDLQIELEKSCNHDMEALVQALIKFFPEHEDLIHRGVTSSDIKDTATSMKMKISLSYLYLMSLDLLDELKRLAIKYKYANTSGYTHGQIAQITTIGSRFLHYYEMVARRAEAIRDARNNIVGKVSGAVGTRPFISPKQEKAILQCLDLAPQLSSSQVVSRDVYADAMYHVSSFMGCLAKMATDIRLMQQGHIGVMAEGFPEGQKGSSAMPHKKNPIKCERVCGLYRLSTGYLSTAMSNIPLWLERDMTHSSAERVIFQDMFHIAAHAIDEMTDVLENLVIDVAKSNDIFSRNINKLKSQQVLVHLVDAGVPRCIAYEVVHEELMRADYPWSWHSFEHEVARRLHRHQITERGILEAMSGTTLHNLDEIYRNILT